MVAVSPGPISEDLKRSVADSLLAAAERCPARGLELVLYRADVAEKPPRGSDFEVNVNGGPRMERSVNTHPNEQPRFWFVLDRAIAHRHGVTVVGPPAPSLFADAARGTLLTVMAESIRWYRTNDPTSPEAVLNAARAWRFAADDVLGAKPSGAQWARQRWASPAIDAAVELRHRRHAQLEAASVEEFVDHVEAILVASR
jgi:hypothetical protein